MKHTPLTPPTSSPIHESPFQIAVAKFLYYCRRSKAESCSGMGMSHPCFEFLTAGRSVSNSNARLACRCLSYLGHLTIETSFSPHTAAIWWMVVSFGSESRFFHCSNRGTSAVKYQHRLRSGFCHVNPERLMALDFRHIDV